MHLPYNSSPDQEPCSQFDRPVLDAVSSAGVDLSAHSGVRTVNGRSNKIIPWSSPEPAQILKRDFLQEMCHFACW